MAQVQRSCPTPESSPAPSLWSPAATDPGFAAAGPVGRMQADLAARLAFAPPAAAGRLERLVRWASVGGGLVALAAGYVAAALLILR